MNHGLIELSQTKTLSKIFKLASKQHNNSNNKPLARKRLAFADSALEQDKLLEYSRYLHKWFWISRFFTLEQTSGRCGVWQHLSPNTPTRTFPQRLDVHLSSGWAWLWVFLYRELGGYPWRDQGKQEHKHFPILRISEMPFVSVAPVNSW